MFILPQANRLAEEGQIKSRSSHGSFVTIAASPASSTATVHHWSDWSQRQGIQLVTRLSKNFMEKNRMRFSEMKNWNSARARWTLMHVTREISF